MSKIKSIILLYQIYTDYLSIISTKCIIFEMVFTISIYNLQSFKIIVFFADTIEYAFLKTIGEMLESKT